MEGREWGVLHFCDSIGQEVHLNVRFVLRLSHVILGLRLGSLSTRWLTVTLHYLLQNSLYPCGWKGCDALPKYKQNAIFFFFNKTMFTSVGFRFNTQDISTGLVSPHVPVDKQLGPFFRMSLSLLLMILSMLPQTLFTCGMFQTGGFERSTTFQVFCWLCLHLFEMRSSQ